MSQILGEEVLSPSSPELQKRVLAAFAVKLQRADVTEKGSLFHGLANTVLQIAKERNYSERDLEAACRKFLATKQYGERIEPAEFFDNNEPEKLYPRSWYLAQKEKGVPDSEFDVYRFPGLQKAMWRRHDGKKLSVGILVNFAGQPINTPKPQEPTTIYPISKPEQPSIGAEYWKAKIEGLEFKLKQANRENERLRAVVEKFKLEVQSGHK